MNLCKIRKRNKVKIVQIRDERFKDRLESFGIYPDNCIVFTGLSVHHYHVILSENRILAVPDYICAGIEV